MDLAIQGDGDTISAKGWVSIDDFVMPKQVDGLDTKIELDVGLTQAKVTVRLGDEDRTIFWAGGEVPVKQSEGAVTLDCDGNIRFRSYVPGVTFKRLAERLPALGDVKGRMSMNFGVSGEACNPDVDLVAAETPVGPTGSGCVSMSPLTGRVTSFARSRWWSKRTSASHGSGSPLRLISVRPSTP